ncbi:MAG: DNA-binding protein Alba [Candidatus Thermoplasmatota archaeon]
MAEETAEENVVYIGNKPAMSYVLAVVTEFKDSDEVVLKARGRAISRAVDAAEISRDRFVKDAKVKDIKIGTETVTNDTGESRNISFMEIYLIKE